MLKNISWILITIILAPILWCRIFLRRLFNKRKKDLRILITGTGKIGDIVCITPVFRAIKKKYPKSYLAVTIQEENYGVVKNNPRVDKIILIDSKKYQGFLGTIKLVKEISKDKFVWSINLGASVLDTILPFWAGINERITTVSGFAGRAHKIFSWFNDYKLEHEQHTLKLRHDLALLRFLGIEESDEKKEIFLIKEERGKAEDFLRKNNLKKNDFLVGITVTSRVKLKEWEPFKFGQLADRLIEELKAKIIFIGSPGDRIIIEEIINDMKNEATISTDFKLNETAALLEKIKLFISVDTGPLHIAHVLNVPVVNIIGPTTLDEQAPRDERSEIVHKDIYCAPCFFNMFAVDYCKEGHHRCIKEIMVDDVFGAVVKLIKRVYI